MRRLALPGLLVLVAAVAAAGAASHWETDGRGVLIVIAQAPAKARTWKNPYADRPDAVAAGQKLFRQHCAECHGDDARGHGHAANLRSSRVQKATPGELVWFLRNGNLAAGMPSWSGLSEQRRWQIVSYLRTLE